MSVNRFLYASNFVVDARQTTSTAPIVKVNNANQGDIFKISVSGSNLPRDLTEINGDLSGAGQELKLFYNNSTVSGATMLADLSQLLTVTAPTAVFNLASTTVSGVNMLVDESTVTLKASSLLTVAAPTAVFNVASTTVSGVNMLVDETNVTLKASSQLNVAAPTAVFNVASTTVSGVSMLVDESTVTLNASSLLTVAAPTAVFNVASTTVSGVNMLVDESTVTLNASSLLTVAAPTAVFNLANTTVSGNDMLVNVSNNSKFKNATFDICDRSDKNIMHVDAKGVTIDGILVVKGDLTTVSSNEVLMGDSHITLNAQQTSNVATSGGLTVVHRALLNLPITSITRVVNLITVTMTALTAGISLPNGSIIQLSGATKNGNNGYYVVDGVAVAAMSATTMNINLKAVGESTIFLNPANIKDETGLTLCNLSHVELSDILVSTDGEISRAFGSKWPLQYVALGNTYKNVKALSALDNQAVSTSITVCLPDTTNPTFKLDLTLPPVAFSNRGAEFKIINRQHHAMKIFTNNNNELINDYNVGNVQSFITLYSGEVESTGVSLIAFYDAASETGGWQLL